MNKQTNNFSFPNKWVGGLSLIIGPILMLIGALLRFQFNFFFPDQLIAFEKHANLITLSYSIFIVGNIALFPGIIILAKTISEKKPMWGLWGGTMTILGLFTRTFHAGVDHLAFQLVNQQGVTIATNIVANQYGVFHIFQVFGPVIMFSWVILSIGAYISKALSIWQCFALLLMSALPLGVLKGTTIASLIAITGLCIALIPFGIKQLRSEPKTKPRDIILWFVIFIIITILCFVVGQLG